MTLEIDMKDPAVRNLMGADDRRVVEAGRPRREMVQIAGDAPDPTGVSRHRGLMSTHRLDTGKHEVIVVYRGRGDDFVLTMDVYAIPGEPMQVHYICPKCHKQGRITQDHKAIEFDPHDQRMVRLPDGAQVPSGGRLSIEPFQCSWELGSEKHTPGIRAGGLSLCKLTLAVDGNTARDA